MATYQVYALDTWFFHSMGSYELEARCEMLAELGYDGTHLMLFSEQAWQDAGRVAEVARRHGLFVAGVYSNLQIDGGDENPSNRRLLQHIPRLEGCTEVHVSLRFTDPAARSTSGVEPARRSLEQLLERATRHDLNVSLYPHVGAWLETLQEAVAVVRGIGHPSLRVIFPLYHWYAIDGARIAERLAEALPFLSSVVLCGTRRTPGAPSPATIEPLYGGELDAFAVVGALKQAGYNRPVGLEGYAIGGDVYARLKRSLDALREIEARLEKYPRWATLQPDRLPLPTDLG